MPTLIPMFPPVAAATNTVTVALRAWYPASVATASAPAQCALMDGGPSGAPTRTQIWTTVEDVTSHAHRMETRVREVAVSARRARYVSIGTQASWSALSRRDMISIIAVTVVLSVCRGMCARMENAFRIQTGSRGYRGNKGVGEVVPVKFDDDYEE